MFWIVVVLIIALGQFHLRINYSAKLVRKSLSNINMRLVITKCSELLVRGWVVIAIVTIQNLADFHIKFYLWQIMV